MKAKGYNSYRIKAGHISAEQLLTFVDQDDLVEDVKKFQSENGLLEDGKIGQKTLKVADSKTSLRCWPMLSYGAVQPTASGNIFVKGKHDGIDIFKGPKEMYGWPNSGGSLVVAAQAGKIILAYQHTNGYRFKIDHGDGWSTNYIHLENKGFAKMGDSVEMGQPLAWLAKEVYPPHLHFETRYGSKPCPPLEWLKNAVYLSA